MNEKFVIYTKDTKLHRNAQNIFDNYTGEKTRTASSISA